MGITDGGDVVVGLIVVEVNVGAKVGSAVGESVVGGEVVVDSVDGERLVVSEVGVL